MKKATKFSYTCSTFGSFCHSFVAGFGLFVDQFRFQSVGTIWFHLKAAGTVMYKLSLKTWTSLPSRTDLCHHMDWDSAITIMQVLHGQLSGKVSHLLAEGPTASDIRHKYPRVDTFEDDISRRQQRLRFTMGAGKGQCHRQWVLDHQRRNHRRVQSIHCHPWANPARSFRCSCHHQCFSAAPRWPRVRPPQSSHPHSRSCQRKNHRRCLHWTLCLQGHPFYLQPTFECYSWNPRRLLRHHRVAITGPFGTRQCLTAGGGDANFPSVAGTGHAVEECHGKLVLAGRWYQLFYLLCSDQPGPQLYWSKLSGKWLSVWD